MYEAPYAFSGPYAGCYADAYTAMDPRHVFTIYSLLRHWPFDNTLEVGSFNGASSTAFIEAINGGATMRALFCDVENRPSLLDVLMNVNPVGRARYSSDHSWDVLAGDEPFDFILLDANHDRLSVSKELGHLLHRRPLCLVAHDTNAEAAGYPRSEGAAMVKAAFEAMPEYFCIEDAVDRPGERTKRGLFLATTDKDLFKIAVQAYETFCPSLEVLA